MKKILSLFLLFNLSTWAFAESVVLVHCPAPEGVEPIPDKKVKSIEELQSKVKFSACDESKILAKVMSVGFSPNHNKAYCEQVEVCLGESVNAENTQAAQEILNDNIPKAVLLGVLDREITQNLEANTNLRNFEEKNKTKLCPVEKIEASCEKDIRNALVSVSGSFLGYKALVKAPLSNESLEDYLGKNLFSKKMTLKISKDQLKKSCDEKINFNRICKARDERVKTIATCEKDKKAIGCLNLEQKALASLNDSHKDNHEVFLNMEKELCVSSRVVNDFVLPSAFSLFALGGFNSTNGMTNDLKNRFSEFANAPGGFGSMPLANSLLDVAYAKPTSHSSSAFAQHEFSIVELDELKINLPASVISDYNFQSSAPVVAAPSKVEEVISSPVESQSGSLASSGSSSSSSHSAESSPLIEADHAENSLTGFAPASSSTPSIAAPVAESTYNNTTTNYGLGDNNINPVIDLPKPLVDKPESVVDTSNAKKANPLNSKISDLQAKIDEMGQTIEDLKANKNPEEKAAATEEALAKEKEMLDLKAKLAALEADKKKIEADKVMASALKEKADTEARRIASINAANNNFAVSTAQEFENNNTKREIEKNQNAYIQPQTYAEAAGRSPASIGSPSQGSTSLVLSASSNGSSNNSESNTVYMTDSDLKKIPFRLSENASAEEIVKMIQESHGAEILIGDKEQVISSIDEKGKVTYRRVKIAVVKNDKEAKAKKAERKTASAADLKREDEKRDLVRLYQLKNTLLNATKKEGE